LEKEKKEIEERMAKQNREQEEYEV